MTENTGFRIEREVDLPVGAEDAWAAFTTDQGSSSWLFPMGVDVPSEVGAAGMGGHVVLVHERPRHLHIRMDGPDGMFNSLEYELSERPDGTVRMRYVHSGLFHTEDWEAQYDGAARHTDFYLHSLAEYLAHFAGRPVAYVTASAPEHSVRPGAYSALLGGLGLDATPAVGDAVRLDVGDLEPVAATVDYVVDGSFLGLRSEDALHRFYVRTAQGAPVQAAHHLFGAEADAGAATAAWTAWLSDVYEAEPAHAQG